MGAGGAALATVISQAVSFISCVMFLAKNKSEFELNMKKSYFTKWDMEMLSDLIKLGTPMPIKSASIMVSKLFVNSWINSYGVAVSAFARIANKISSISVLVSNAMNALLNGSGNYRINFVTAILDGIVMRIGLAVLFGLTFGMKHYGFWLGDALAGFTPFFIGVVFYYT